MIRGFDFALLRAGLFARDLAAFGLGVVRLSPLLLAAGGAVAASGVAAALLSTLTGSILWIGAKFCSIQRPVVHHRAFVFCCHGPLRITCHSHRGGQPLAIQATIVERTQRLEWPMRTAAGSFPDWSMRVIVLVEQRNSRAKSAADSVRVGASGAGRVAADGIGRVAGEALTIAPPRRPLIAARQSVLKPRQAKRARE